jgi:hypothetical protein
VTASRSFWSHSVPMRVVRRHAGHLMAKQGLAYLIVHPQPLKACGKGMAQVMKMKVLYSTPWHVASQYFLKALISSNAGTRMG